MLKAIRQFFDAHLQPATAGNSADSEHALRLATAALLIETSRADFDVDDNERTAVVDSVQRIFGLTVQETSELVRLAEKEADDATSLYQFTSLIDKNFTVEQKRHVLEMMWRITFADAQKDKHEEHLVRKVTDLLHLTEVDFARTRHKVESETQQKGIPPSDTPR